MGVPPRINDTSTAATWASNNAIWTTATPYNGSLSLLDGTSLSSVSLTSLEAFNLTNPAFTTADCLVLRYCPNVCKCAV